MATPLTPTDPVELLDALKGHPILAPYSLAVYSPTDGILASRGTPPPFCTPPGLTPLCGDGAKCPLPQAAREAHEGAAPTVCQCHLSVLGFAIILDRGDRSLRSLVGWGVRADAINLSYLERQAQKCDIEPFALLDQWGNLATAGSLELKRVTEKVAALIPSLKRENLHSQLLEKTVEQLNTVVGISAQLDKATDADAVYRVLSESLGIFFDFPSIAVAVPDSEPQAFIVRGTWGLTGDLATVSRDRFFFPRPQKMTNLRRGDLPELFRNIGADRAAAFPLTTEGELHGILLLFGVEPHQRDAMQIEILCDKVATRLKRLQTDPHPLFDVSLPDRLIGIIGLLAAAETSEELYRRILESAASLQRASSGSLMLLDEKGLRIEAALGINTHISRTMRIRIGEGIAGKVAASGKPIVVNDIENDSRIAATNRPRFKTKSFLSVPLKLKDRMIGVLNLSDKENDENFTAADLQLLTILTAQACVLIERSELLEKTGKLEQLTMSDLLTGLYNRASIVRRMDEEVNRSSRQELTFSILLIELDYFSLYTELCGQSSANVALTRGAELLYASARQMDAVSRYGEETFCIILPGTAGIDAVTVAERIRSAIGREAFPLEENLPTGKLTASIGIASYPENGEDSALLLEGAECALYRAKAEGRDAVRSQKPAPPAHAESAVSLTVERAFQLK